jgi:hypothetical protein
MPFKIIGFIVFLIVLNIIGCSIKGKSGHNGLATVDCMPDRKSQESMTNQYGSIIKVAEQFVLQTDGENQRFIACNLPESYHKEGLKVNFSILIKEIFPNERWAATPVVLQEINPITK